MESSQECGNWILSKCYLFSRFTYKPVCVYVCVFSFNRSTFRQGLEPSPVLPEGCLPCAPLAPSLKLQSHLITIILPSLWLHFPEILPVRLLEGVPRAVPADDTQGGLPSVCARGLDLKE